MGLKSQFRSRDDLIDLELAWDLLLFLTFNSSPVNNTNRISFSVLCFFCFPALYFLPTLISFINSRLFDQNRKSADCGAARWLCGDTGRLTANNLPKQHSLFVQDPSKLFPLFSQQQHRDLLNRTRNFFVPCSWRHRGHFLVGRWVARESRLQEGWRHKAKVSVFKFL